MQRIFATPSAAIDYFRGVNAEARKNMLGIDAPLQEAVHQALKAGTIFLDPAKAERPEQGAMMARRIKKAGIQWPPGDD